MPSDEVAQQTAISMRLDFERLKNLGLEIFNRGLFDSDQARSAASMLDRLEAIVEAAEAKTDLRWTGEAWEFKDGKAQGTEGALPDSA